MQGEFLRFFCFHYLREIGPLAAARLRAAHNTALAPESRFDLAYNAAHSLAPAALRKKGFRSNNRYRVFQCLPHTVGAGPEIWRVLDKCHLSPTGTLEPVVVRHIEERGAQRRVSLCLLWG